MESGFKTTLLALSLFCATMLAGCLTSPGTGTGTDVTALAASLPQVKAFLEQYPNAKISVALWDSAVVGSNIETIRAECGEQFPVADYYRVSVTDPSFTLVVWLDKSSQNVMCAVKAASSNNYVPTGEPSKLPGPSPLPTSSATIAPSNELPPMPPDDSSTTSAQDSDMPPLPPEPVE